LATISAAFVMHELDVIEAEAYTRTGDSGKAEALDIFRVRPAIEPLTEEELRRVNVTLTEVLEAKRAIESLGLGAKASEVSDTTVRFLEDASGRVSTLEVETSNRSGLLLALARALFNQRVQIVGSSVRTTGARVFDRFFIQELDGSPISSERRLEVQVAVLGAIEAG
jgi:[protein-PII] uridylyltransferase